MSGTVDDDEIEVGTDEGVNGHAVSDDDLRSLLAAETERRKEAQRRARDAEAKYEQAQSRSTAAEGAVRNATTQRFDTELSSAAAKITALDAQAENLMREYETAVQEGEYRKTAEIQRKMARLEAEKMQAEGYETYLKGEKAKSANAPEAAPQQQTAEVDLAAFTPAQRKWIRQNPEYMEDPKLRRRAAHWHQEAVDEGIEIDTPEYFDYISRALPKAKQATREPEEEEPTARRRPSTEIPVSRGSSPGQPRSTTVKLSPEQREAADMTMPEVPVDGHRDTQGVWIPGRYERYNANMKRMKESGRM